MRLGKRSTRIRAGFGGQLTRLAVRLLAASLTAAAFLPPALAQRAAAVTVGPERIVCNASFCEMGSAARPKQRVRVIVSNLPEDQIRRLRKCTGAASPCIVTIAGTEDGDQMKIMASSIRWQDTMEQY